MAGTVTGKKQTDTTTEAFLKLALLGGWVALVCWLWTDGLQVFVNFIFERKVVAWLSKAGIPWTVLAFQFVMAWMGSSVLVMALPVILWLRFCAT